MAAGLAKYLWVGQEPTQVDHLTVAYSIGRVGFYLYLQVLD